MKKHYIVSGGASHGPSLWGAVQERLESTPAAGWAGASVGATIAAAEALGIEKNIQFEAMHDLFGKNRLTAGKDPISIRPRIVWSRGGGLHDWTAVRDALRRLFGKRTMGQAKVPLTVMVGDTYLGRSVPVTSWQHPKALVWEVLAASTALWPIADAQTIPSLGTGLRLYVDGGWGNNVPSQAYVDRPEPSLIFCMEKALPERPPNGAIQIALSCLEMAIYASAEIQGRSDEEVITVPAIGSGFDFDLSPEEVDARILTGRRAARRQ